MLKTHFHAHLAIYYKGEQIAVPRGIGIIAPLRIDRGFVSGGKGFYWLHTHDASGILHVESPNDRVYTLGNFFDVWGQPLAADNVAGLRGALRVYVNGKVQFTPVRDLPSNRATDPPDREPGFYGVSCDVHVSRWAVKYWPTSVHHAVAIDKLLLHACGRPMGFRRMFDQFEGIAELGVQRIGRIPHHREPAALHRPVRRTPRQ